MFQIIWKPYKNVIDNLSNFCKNDQDIWRTISPLICFHIGESHHLDRMLKQFDLKQNILLEYNTEPLLHNIDMRVTDWLDKVAHLVVRWRSCRRFMAIEVLTQQFDMDVPQEGIY